MKELQRLLDDGLLAPVDVQLGNLLGRRAAATLGDIGEVNLVALSGALVSAERARGHSCLDIGALAGTSPWPETATGLVLPDMLRWRATLERSGVCTEGGEPAPLVLEGDRLYLYRFHAAERRLAEAVRSRLAPDERAAASGDATRVALFRALFDVGAPEAVDWQAVAAAAALRGRLTVVTGGPGTGKTTTVARVLALLLEGAAGLRIAVAAPTGKAAARLAQSIRDQAAMLPVSDVVRDALPREGRTLHRLLGYQPWRDRFSFGPEQPLAEDVVVVDEASMADLLMMDALFAALRPSARIILLGDQDQLASVETGYVLGDLCRAAESCGQAHGVAFGEWYARLSGQRIPTSEAAPAIRDCVIRLRESFRFARHRGIGALAEAVREGDADAAIAVLEDGRYPDARGRQRVQSTAELLEALAPEIERYLDAESPDEALERLSDFRLLCAVREGPAGVSGLNDAVERWLRARGHATRLRWYDRRPVLVTENDPAAGLFNGDVGVTLSQNGRTLVHFADPAGGTRAFGPARLPAHETAWAMTVHKAQGSEFTRVVLLLPDEESRVLTRELLYTGVTRAKESVVVVGSREILSSAIAATVQRASGLRDRLLGVRDSASSAARGGPRPSSLVPRPS